MKSNHIYLLTMQLQELNRSYINFYLQDRGDPAYETKAIAGHGFNAEFASDNAEYRALWDMPGIDGFTMNLEPLYRVGLSALKMSHRQKYFD